STGWRTRAGGVDVVALEAVAHLRRGGEHQTPRVRLDPHSYADSEQAQTRRIDLAPRAHLGARVLEGEIALHLREPGEGPFDLDARSRSVGAGLASEGAPLRTPLSPPEPILGARLRVELPPASRGVRVRYATSPAASALQWLDPVQTAGEQPFLY